MYHSAWNTLALKEAQGMERHRVYILQNSDDNHGTLLVHKENMLCQPEYEIRYAKWNNGLGDIHGIGLLFTGYYEIRDAKWNNGLGDIHGIGLLFTGYYNQLYTKQKTIFYFT
jgi:hypothetical protein